MTIYGDRLKKWMRARGLNQTRLAKASGVRQATISRILSGEIPNPKGDTLRRLASAMGLEVGELTDPRRVEPAAECREPPAPPYGPSLGQALATLAARLDGADPTIRGEALTLVARYLSTPEARPRLGLALDVLLRPTPGDATAREPDLAPPH